MNEQWLNKKAAFLGDSITDKIHVGTTKNYWEYLAEYCGIIPLVYGINGCSWAGIIPQGEQLLAEHGEDVDAIFVFMGTNDYNGGVPLGEWFETAPEKADYNGRILERSRRRFSTDAGTFRGRINLGMDFLKRHFPRQQIILFTPIHRGYARFSETNVQPEESFPNVSGLYLEAYIDCLLEAGRFWAVPVIDLNAVSGLMPVLDEYAYCFHDAATDRLHPNAAGHERIARALMYQLQMYPADFR